MKFILFTLFLFHITHAEPITPLVKIENLNPKKVLLGEKLFFDPILSADNTISCASCHNLKKGGDDDLKFSFGIRGQRGDINAPTVLNAAYNFRQFWNGSVKTLKHQTWGPIENPVEMGNTFEKLIATLKKTPYKKEFDAIYKEGITKNSIGDAIAEFEKTLITLNSPFDKYLKGDKEAIMQEQKEGYTLFKTKGCIACHHGINIGGNLYNKFGVMKDTNSTRLGRYEITHKDSDKFYFKVPTLRNIKDTAPYLHDGRFSTLEDTIKFMANYQLGRSISENEVNKIVSFLNALSGELPTSIDK